MSTNRWIAFLKQAVFEFWMAFYYIKYSPKLLILFICREFIYLFEFIRRFFFKKY